MLMRFDPIRDFDRLAQEAWGRRPPVMPMDAYRSGDHFVVHFDLPGVDPSAIDLTVERNVLTVTAERSWQPREGDQVIAAERSHGSSSRQLFLGEGLDADRLEASCDNGVLTLRIPVAEKAKPRKVSIAGAGANGAQAIETSATAS